MPWFGAVLLWEARSAWRGAVLDFSIRYFASTPRFILHRTSQVGAEHKSLGVLVGWIPTRVPQPLFLCPSTTGMYVQTPVTSLFNSRRVMERVCKFLTSAPSASPGGTLVFWELHTTSFAPSSARMCSCRRVHGQTAVSAYFCDNKG